MSSTRYTVKQDGDSWVALRRPENHLGYPGYDQIGHRPKYKQAQRLCEQSAGQPLEWTRTPEGYAATR